MNLLPWIGFRRVLDAIATLQASVDTIGSNRAMLLRLESIDKRLGTLEGRVSRILENELRMERDIMREIDRLLTEVNETLTEIVATQGTIAQAIRDGVNTGDTAGISAAADSLDAAQASLEATRVALQGAINPTGDTPPAEGGGGGGETPPAEGGPGFGGNQ